MCVSIIAFTVETTTGRQTIPQSQNPTRTRRSPARSSVNAGNQLVTASPTRAC